MLCAQTHKFVLNLKIMHFLEVTLEISEVLILNGMYYLTISDPLTAGCIGQIKCSILIVT